MKLKFYVPNFDTWDKDLVIGYVGEAAVTIDYDDVDHSVVQEILPLIVKAVNGISKEDIKAAVKRAREKNNE